MKAEKKKKKEKRMPKDQIALKKKSNVTNLS